MSVEQAEDRVPLRSEQDAESTWDLEVLYASIEEWEQAFSSIEEKVEPLRKLKGRLNTPESLADWYKLESELDRLLESVYVYAHLRADEDTGNADHQARQARIKTRYTEISGELSWMLPEVLEHDVEELKRWVSHPALREYVYLVEQVIRMKPHILSHAEEHILSNASDIFANSRETYGLLTNADLEFPDVVDEKGRARALSQGRYVTFLMNRNREVRKRAFEAMYDTYGGVKNTLASTLSGTVKYHNFASNTRHHKSAIEASLFSDNIPLSLYEGLIETVHRELPSYFNYLGLRSEVLGIDPLDMYDMYVPLVPSYDMNVPYEEACEWVLEACRPLGEEYSKALKTAFEDRWVDVYENKGKRSGAYSSGCYDSRPYVLMNYQGTLDHVFTLAHELGHSMHSLLANETQPHHYASYPIFIAEIASTLNEELLLRWLLEKHDEPNIRAYLLNHMCDGFKGTVYRQTMFAEYEKIIHEMDASGQPLTAQSLSESYFKLNQRYFGETVKPSQAIELEWSRIPHFYYNFYVYKYATSYCAAQIFTEQVLQSDDGRERYLNLLKSGGSNPPLNLIQEAGVDLARPETLSRAFQTFAARTEELKGMLQSL